MSDIPSAWLRPRIKLAIVPLLLVIGVAWSARHLYESYLALGYGGHPFALLWTLTFLWVVVHVGLSWFERPFEVTERERSELDRLRVTMNVPVYNEDPATLRTALQSILNQTRPVQRIQVVNDGSTANLAELVAVRKWWLHQRRRHPGSRLEWIDVPNAGKRHAQIRTFRGDDADLFATVDSDTVLDWRCIEEAIKPFIRPDVTSVASMVLARNIGRTFVRVTDTWLLSFQLTFRGAMSKLGCVLVNSGACSLYRAEVVREAIPSYESELFFGRRVTFSDDSMLTLFAHLRGRTVQQPTSFAFAMWPSNVSHHLRQQLRWMRGSTIRSLWRFRYLKLRDVAYWDHLMSWINFILVLFAFGVIFVIGPIVGGVQFGLSTLLFTLLICYTAGSKYLTIARSDRGFGFQLRTFMLAPVMVVWTSLVLRPLRIYSILTCFRTGWGTRAKVEV